MSEKQSLEGLIRDTDRHGNIRHYCKSPCGKKIRLNPKGIEIGSEGYMSLYRDAREGKLSTKAISQIPEGTISALVNAYLHDPASPFKNLGLRTQYVYRLRALKLQKEHGHQLANALTPQIIERGKQERRGKPEGANNRIRILRAIYSYGVSAGIVSHNPAAEVAFYPSKSGGWHAWAESEIEQYEKFHPVGTMPRLAFDIFLYTGVRRSDLVRLGPQHIQDGFLIFSQQKTKKHVELPILDKLMASIEATQTGNLVFIVNQYGRPFTSDGFGNAMRRWCDAAGLQNCSAHGLRKVMGSRLADSGATPYEIAAVLGHSNVRSTETYTKRVTNKRLAESALQRLSSKLAP